MRIGGYDKLSTVDYPGEMACAIFLVGCNFNCGYCHNPSLISGDGAYVPKEEVMEYLKFRRNMLDAVCISGGEPTCNKDLKEFIKEIKSLGYKVKLDTNGTHPEVIKDLLDENLLDYIAMDIKAIPDKYLKVINKKIDFNKILESIDLIKKSNIKYEFRTTIMKDVHDKKDIIKILKLIGDSKLYLQNFQYTDVVKDKKIKSFSRDELLKLKEELKDYPNVIIRYV